MTAQTTEAPVITCQCGCGRELGSGRGDGHGYANACRKRWQRQGRPPGGPRPSVHDVAAARTRQLDALFAEGLSYAGAAERLGIPVRAVEKYARALNQRKRDQGAREGGDLRPARPLPGAHWQARAACRDHPDLFFGPESERLADRQARETGAKLLCGVCPVLAGCAQYAERLRVQDGVWAGVSETDREREKKQRAAQARAERDRRNAAARREQDGEMVA